LVERGPLRLMARCVVERRAVAELSYGVAPPAIDRPIREDRTVTRVLSAAPSEDLIAAKRADAISSEIALHTEKNTDDTKTLIQENTDLLDEILLHVANIGKKVGAEMGHFAPGDTPPTAT
jgi:hypothetical protein